MNSKCLVNIFELRRNNRNQTIVKEFIEPEVINCCVKNILNDSDTIYINNLQINNKLVLNIYPKTTSIIANTDDYETSSDYFINSLDNKLYKFDTNGQNPQLVNGNYLIIMSNINEYINKAFQVVNGELNQLTSYFDGSNLKLIIEGNEEKKDGMLILTDDYKIFVRINNMWFGK